MRRNRHPMRHHRQATIIVDFMYELYHLYDEVALTKEEEKVPKKINTTPRRSHPSTTKNLNHPEYSLLELLTVQRSILPYSSPDWNGILADKESAQGFKYPAGRENISSKTQQQVALFAKQNKYISTSRKTSQNQHKQHNTLLREKKNNVRGNTKRDLKQIRL